MLVKQIDPIGPEPLQRRVGDVADMRRTAVEPAILPSSMWKPNFVAMTTRSRTGSSASPTSSSFVIRAVHFRGIEERHTGVDRGANDRDPVLVGQRRSVLWLIPMQPKPSADTSKPFCPDVRFCIAMLLLCVSSHGRWRIALPTA